MTKKTRKTIIISFIAVVVMFGFGFALIPLYDTFCQITGLNGKPSGMVSKGDSVVDESRTITVELVATNNAQIPWEFYPKVKKITLHPGENKRFEFYAKNISNHTIVGQAVPSVSPNIAAKYILKTECFCFNQQTLKPGESMDMPVIFHVDPDLPAYINTITLSYTLFDASNVKTRPTVVPGKIKG